MTRISSQHRFFFVVPKPITAGILTALIGIAAFAVHGQVHLTATHLAYTQDFDTLGNTPGGTTFTTLPSGWQLTVMPLRFLITV